MLISISNCLTILNMIYHTVESNFLPGPTLGFSLVFKASKSPGEHSSKYPEVLYFYSVCVPQELHSQVDPIDLLKT